jgi:hypothetical protein
MSVQQTRSGELLASYPEYVLSCLYDDEDDPSEVTVFSGTDDDRSTTEWITADVESTMALDELQ